MKYEIDQQETQVVFRPLEARLNASHVAALKSHFTVLAHSQPGGVVVDLTSVQSVDSSVLSALLLLRRILDGQGRPLVVVAPGPGVRSVFSLSKLDEIFTLMPTIDEALKYLHEQETLLAKKKAEEEEEDLEEEDWDEEDWEDEDWEEEEDEDWDEEDWEDEDWEEEDEDWDEDEEEWEEEEEEEEED